MAATVKHFPHKECPNNYNMVSHTEVNHFLRHFSFPLPSPHSLSILPSFLLSLFNCSSTPSSASPQPPPSSLPPLSPSSPFPLFPVLTVSPLPPHPQSLPHPSLFPSLSFFPLSSQSLPSASCASDPAGHQCGTPHSPDSLLPLLGRIQPAPSSLPQVHVPQVPDRMSEKVKNNPCCMVGYNLGSQSSTLGGKSEVIFTFSPRPSNQEEGLPSCPLRGHKAASPGEPGLNRLWLATMSHYCDKPLRDNKNLQFFSHTNMSPEHHSTVWL